MSPKAPPALRDGPRKERPGRPARAQRIAPPLRRAASRQCRYHLLLCGGDRRSIGGSDRVVALVLRQPRTFRELLRCLWSDDPIVRMRAADAAEKITANRPVLLAPFKSELLGLAEEATQSELRWHLAVMLPRLPLSAAQRERAIAVLRRYLNDRSSIVKTMAIQGWFELAQGHPSFEQEMFVALEEFSRNGTPAMRARSRRLLDQLRRRAKGAPCVSGT